MAKHIEGGLSLVPGEFRTLPELAEDQDFICQNPEPDNMIYAVWSDDQPEVNETVVADRIPPYAFYGRENSADVELRQGKVWFRAQRPVDMPFKK